MTGFSAGGFGVACSVGSRPRRAANHRRVSLQRPHCGERLSLAASGVPNGIFAQFYRVLLGSTWFYLVLLGFTGFYRVLLGFYRVLLGFTGFYWVLLGFTGFTRYDLNDRVIFSW